MTLTAPPPTATDDAPTGGLRARRTPRSLPSGRALVGALLVTTAAVIAFASVRSTQHGPEGSIVVADGSFGPGERLTPDRLRVVTVDLPGPLVDRTYGSVDEVAGSVAVAALTDGDPILRTGVVDAAQTPVDQRVFSFSLDKDRALDGALQAGEALDLLATYGSGESAVTQVVARRAVVVRVDDSGRGGLGGAGRITVTVALPTDDEVVRVAHASQVAAVTLVRAADPGPAGPTPEARTPGVTRTGASTPGTAAAIPASTPSTRPGGGSG